MASYKQWKLCQWIFYRPILNTLNIYLKSTSELWKYQYPQFGCPHGSKYIGTKLLRATSVDLRLHQVCFWSPHKHSHSDSCTSSSQVISILFVLCFVVGFRWLLSCALGSRGSSRCRDFSGRLFGFWNGFSPRCTVLLFTCQYFMPLRIRLVVLLHSWNLLFFFAFRCAACIAGSHSGLLFNFGCDCGCKTF